MQRRVNPYEPSRTDAPHAADANPNGNLFVPYRLDWLVSSAIAFTVLVSYGTYLVQSNGTGVIVDPILSRLVAHSVIWIPIYRLGSPILLPLMPDVARQTYGVLFLSIGVLFSINNLSGHYFGNFVFVDNLGFFPTVGFCFGLALIVFCLRSVASGNVLRSLRNTAFWLAIAVLVHVFLYGASRLI